ncbi:MAG: helix-turn-helix domain-containing protein [Patescibacteria group bacterium]
MKQSEALEILKMGKNVFLTGPAGSGKTYLLNQYIDILNSHRVPVGKTASTGIAATHMNGVTIHSWSGLGIKDQINHHDLEKLLKKAYLKKRFKFARVLIIDEISMLHAHQLDAVDNICRSFLDEDLPFGGLQVVLCGDFFQLPPINRFNEKIRFAYHSNIWQDMDLHVCYLEEQYRQEDNDSLIEILNAIRRKEVDQEILEKLKNRENKNDKDFVFTKLFTHNQDVDSFNLQELDKIGVSSKIFRMKEMGNKKILESLKKSCLAPETLRLKEGASVMFVKNNFEKGYVNGTLGKIISFEGGLPVVETYKGLRILVKEEPWHIEEDGVIKAKITQIPLRLAWAITVHKSQGMSLDLAEIDLSKSFVEGMGYVALSRVRSLEGLFLKGLNDMALRINDEIYEFDNELQIQSEKVVESISKLKDKEKKEIQDKFLKVSKVEEDYDERVSTYEITKEMIAQEMMLEDIARERNLAVSTIISHLEKLNEERGKGRVNFSYLKQDINDFERILEAWKEIGGDKLSPIKKVLPDNISWEDIRLVKLFI